MFRHLIGDAIVRQLFITIGYLKKPRRRHSSQRALSAW